MEWIFIIMAVGVIWLVERELNDLSAGIKGLEHRMLEIAEELEDFKKAEEAKSKAQPDSPNA